MVVADAMNGRVIALGDTAFDPSMPRPDEMRELFRKGKVDFRAFHGQCQEMYNYYYGRNVVPTPEGFDPVKPAQVRALIDDLTAHIDINNLDVDVPDTPRTKARAERLKKFYLGAWLQIPAAIRRSGVQDAAAYGIAFWKFMFEPELWPDAPVMADFGVEGTGGNIVLIDEAGYKEALHDWEDKRSISFPIRAFNPSPMNMIWDTSRAGAKWHIEFYQDQTVREIRQRYPSWVRHAEEMMNVESGTSARERATWWEYWDDTWVTYFMDNSVVYGPVKHGYGESPYVAIDSGAALGWSDGWIQDRWQGIAQPILGLIDSKARHMTMYEAILRQTAYRSVDFASSNKNEALAVSQDYELSAGKNIIGRVEVKASPTVQAPQELLAFAAVLDNEIEAATVPSVVRGQRPTGVSAGFPISVLAGLARLKFQPIADATATAMQEGNVRFAKFVENKIRGKITVRARTEVHEFDQSIEPNDIRGYYENSVKLKAEAPEEREREALLAMRLYQALPGFPLVEALKRAGIANPLEAIMQRRGEDVSALLMEKQAEQALAKLAGGFNQQLASSGLGQGVNTGNQFQPGQQQLQRPGERNIQQARSASQDGRPSVFPQGQGGLDILGSLLGTAPGGAQGVPSGQTIRP